MKQITLTNNMLVAIYNSVYVIPTNSTEVYNSSKLNRSKNKLLELIDKKMNELEHDRVEILKEFADKNENGEPIENEDGTYKLNKSNDREANEQVKVLLEEDVCINYGEYSSRIKEFMEYLDNYDGELDGRTGQAVYWLLEAYDEAEDVKEENTKSEDEK